MTKYFAYGSNLDPAHLRRRCPQMRILGAACLSGYALRFLYPSTSFPGGGAADIVAEPGGEVWGALYELSDSDFAALDDFEDVAESGYRRISVTVVHDGDEIEAVTYEVVSKLDAEMAPIAAYAELLASGAVAHGLPDNYLETLRERLAEASFG